ncbi:MAG: helix-turn-helix transcriptional regulator [Tepidiformaceae bacterium]
MNPGDPEPGPELTPREQEVLDLAVSGLTNKAIAAELGITKNAVRFHLKEIHSKLDTGGKRQILAMGWRRALAILAWPAAKMGTPLTVAAFMGGIVVVGFGAYQAYPGDSSGGPADVSLVNGRYPNGCAAEYNAGTMTLEDFAFGRTTLDEMRRLNPGLPLGPLPPETIVKVPYDPSGECGQLEPTPLGAPRRFGTPPSP